MNMKRCLIGAVSACMVMGGMTLTASAAGDSLWIESTNYDAASDQSGTGWSWDADTDTLTLDGYNGGAIAYHCVDSTAVCSIVVTGENTVTYSSEDSAYTYGDGISIGCEVNVSGTGTLRVVGAEDDGISAYDGEAALTMEGITYEVEADYGIYADEASITDVIMMLDCRYDGILADDTTITGSSLEVFLRTEIQGDSVKAFSCDTLTLDSSDVTVTFEGGMESTKYSCAFYGDELIVRNGSTVTADGICDFLLTDNNMTISDSTVTGTITGWGLSAYDGTLVIQNSEISLECLDSIDNWSSYGIYASDVSIIGSDVTLKAQDAALSIGGSLSIQDSAVSFTNIDSEGVFNGTYTLTYTVPEYWTVYVDEEASEEYTVESTDINFGLESFAIVYSHECTFTDWTDDENGTTHTGTCECGETETQDHVWGEGVESDTEIVYTCEVCGAQKREAKSPETGMAGEAMLYGMAALAGLTGIVASTRRKRK